MDPYQEDIKKRQDYARSIGWSEDQIAKSTLVETANHQTTGATQPNQTVSPSDISTPGTTAAPTQDVSGQPATITGHTLLEHQKALLKARAAGDQAAIKQISDQYDTEYQYQKDYGLSAKQKDATMARQDTLQKAYDLIDVINKGKSGELQGQQYTDALNSAASMYTASKAFGEGGKNLTATELSVLSGQIPVIQQRTGTIPEKFSAWWGGYKIPQTGELAPAETPDRLLNKMTRVINTLDPNAKIPYPTGKEAAQAEKEKEKANYGHFVLDGLVGNALNEVAGFAVALPNMGKMLIDLTPPGEMIRRLQGHDVNKEDADMVKAFLGGLVDDLSKTTGLSIKGVAGDQSKFNDVQPDKLIDFDLGSAWNHDWNHPLSTLAYAATFFKVAKLGMGLKAGAAGTEVAKVADMVKAGMTEEEAAAAASKGLTLQEVAAQTGKVFPNTPPATPADIGAIKGRLFTSVGVPVPESVSKSELLMKDALQITKSNTTRGIAKELEAFVPKTGANIDAYAKALDKVIGPEPMDETITYVMQKVAQNTAAQASPELASRIDEILRNKLNVQELPGGLQRGEPFGTTITKMNETRKFLNSSISRNWFENGQPMASATDQLNALKWEASNALKDIMIEADQQGGYFQKAINLQHSALSTSPVLSKVALVQGQFPKSPWSAAFQAVEKPVGAVWEQGKIRAARFAAGAPSDLVKSITEGKFPAVPPAEGAVPAAAGAAPAVAPAAGEVPATPQKMQFPAQAPETAPSATLKTPNPRKPLDQQIINRAIEGKGPAQQKRLLRDMRYKTWIPRGTKADLTRAEQEKLLQQSAKRKYH